MKDSIEELFIRDKNICKELKLLQFDEPCFARFGRKGNWQLNFLGKPYLHNSGAVDKEFVGSPTYEQVVNWFRVQHNSIIIVQVESFEREIYSGRMENIEGFYETDDYNDYYLAFNEIIDYAIKTLK